MIKALISASIFSLALVGCQQASTAPDIRIENASLRTPLPGQTTAVAYFDIVNQGGADVLLSATSNISSRVELHDHIHEGGVMKMRGVDQVNVPANSTVSFKSGGLHVMMFDATIEDAVSLTFDFETHEDITVELKPLAN